MQNRAPYKLLLDSSKKGKEKGGRTQQQIELLTELCVNNKIFDYIGLAKNSLRQICNNMTLIWTDNPHANEISQNQAYLILEGKAFEYLQNNSFALKSRLYQNDQYLMVRKLNINDFFIVHTPQTKYSQQDYYKKYQLMVDKNTLVGKISGEVFKSYFLPLIQQRQKKITTFLKRVQMLESIPQLMLYELSKYMSLVSVQAGTFIINRNQKNLNVYFILKGEVEYKIINETTARQSPSKNYQTINTKPFKKANLKQNEVFGIDAFNSETYEQLDVSYSTQAKTNCELYKIDKRILAIVISSFDNVLPKSNKIWSSVNLNEQILGQGHQNADTALLSRNAEKIKTSQKRIRDIKLRFYNTSQRNRTSRVNNEFYGEKKQQQLLTLEDVKYQSCHNFAQIKVSKDRNKRFLETFNSKFKINNYPEIEEAAKTKVTSILISPYEQNQTEVPEGKKQPFNAMGYSNSFKSFLAKRKSDSNVSSTGKQESDIIRTYLQRKLKNQMLKKAQLILQRNKQKKLRQGSKIKRIFSLKNVRKQSVPKTKQIGEQLYNRMTKLTENPLLSQIEGQRKKLERQTVKLKQSQIRNAQNLVISKKIGGNQKQKADKKQLIIIQNN